MHVVVFSYLYWIVSSFLLRPVLGSDITIEIASIIVFLPSVLIFDEGKSGRTKFQSAAMFAVAGVVSAFLAFAIFRAANWLPYSLTGLLIVGILNWALIPFLGFFSVHLAARILRIAGRRWNVFGGRITYYPKRKSRDYLLLCLLYCGGYIVLAGVSPNELSVFFFFAVNIVCMFGFCRDLKVIPAAISIVVFVTGVLLYPRIFANSPTNALIVLVAGISAYGVLAGIFAGIEQVLSGRKQTRLGETLDSNQNAI